MSTAPSVSTDNVSRLMGVYAQRTGENDRETLVSDLLADLMHYCNEYGIDFDDQLSRATDHYAEEKGGA